MRAMLPYAAFTAVALCALLVGHARGRPAVVRASKPAASAGFVAGAVALGAPGSPYGRLVLAALVLSLLGDVLLIPAGAKRTFLAGMACFGLAHVAYIAAFVVRGVRAPAFILGVAVVLGGLAAGLPRLAPHLPGRLRFPVAAYVAAVGVMVAAAVATAAAKPTILVPLGAVLFAGSDAFVARHRFIAPSFSNKALGLPMYYAAQLILALSVAAA